MRGGRYDALDIGGGRCEWIERGYIRKGRYI